MTNKIKGTYIDVDESNITTKKSLVRQLVDIIQSDIKGSSSTRKKYEVFVSGGQNLEPIKSGIFQTVHDQDHTLQTSNPMFDITIGLCSTSTTYTGIRTSTDSGGKDLFPNSSLMMREKNHVYKQYAQNVLGNPDSVFYTSDELTKSSDVNDKIDEAIFLNINRLFTRDKIKKESFAMRYYKSAAYLKGDSDLPSGQTGVEENISGSHSSVPTGMPSSTGVDYTKVYDTGASSNKRVHPVAGEWEILKDDQNPTSKVGLIFYDLGIIVFDASRLFENDQVIRGLIQDTESTQSVVDAAGGDVDAVAPFTVDFPFAKGQSVFNGAFIPNFWREGSIDDIVDHICETRFGEANLTAFAFKNETTINSSLVYCRLNPSQLNFSTNPTYTDSNGKLRVISEDGDEGFSYVTTIGLHNTNNELLAVAKLSRPVEKNQETDLSIRIRLDY